jgi:hypothetical protein
LLSWVRLDSEQFIDPLQDDEEGFWLPHVLDTWDKPVEYVSFVKVNKCDAYL